MARVSRSPRSVDALIEAGGAASATGDDDAAIGFYRRAEQVAPADVRVLTGLAAALLRANDPVAALSVYARAERAGSLAPTAIGDHGLAFDLVGDNARAQQSYRQSLTLAEDHEVTRRLALSQAIAGDGRTAELTLRPLLQQQDKAGWRTRAFIFAISGQVDEAVTVAKTLLPGDLADAITPYLRFMPRLTRAQQAAAANLGVFPQAAAIGRDDPRIARYAVSGGVALASADNPLVPKGAPLGRSASSRAGGDDMPRTRTRAELAADRAVRIAPPEPPPARQIPTDDALAASGSQVLQLPSGPADSAGPRTLSGVRVPQLAVIAEPALAPRTVRPSLADAFGDIGAPDVPAKPRAGAVDVTRLAPVRPKPATVAIPPQSSATSALASRTSAPRSERPEPAAPSHPSRIWVQLGIGHDHAALRADWRRMLAQADEALKGRQPFVSDSGTRDRMLTGPFQTDMAARAFVQQLGAAGLVGPYIWVSPAGQVVDPLTAR